MRIRKRSVPLPFTSLCPVSLPDPQVPMLPLPAEAQREQNAQARRDAAAMEGERETMGLHPNEDRSLEAENVHLNRPPSSPNQTLSEVVGVKEEENRPRSELQLVMKRRRGGWICSDAADRHHQQTKKEYCMRPINGTPVNEEIDLQREEKKDGRSWSSEINTIRKGSSLGSEAGDGISLLPSSSDQEVGRWCEGEKAFPLKKRRGRLGRTAGGGTIMENENKMKATNLKTKTNKKWVKLEDEDDEEEAEDQEEQEQGTIPKQQGVNGNNNTNVKKRGSGGGVIMEGSRCSRVNGRGWRCCQQTLVGYSLCEHHLGKGRLRSMSSVRGRASAGAKKGRPSSSSAEKQSDETLPGDGEVEDYEKPLMITKKRKKIGVVKARSISSLLGQTQN
ncbi:PREDICTED: uncharacterized protein LOC104603562 [Nelumbo nucifera]|uniref:Uncharacterized protein LOC104603562 n=1 Tax=Nelumbo nucifera TaxID=4432 RepID=A0A1U8ASX4_NELNU|nr:PREDICTED: uncharacterized protein LOC104603562 [Nelumbo nucifera]